MISVAICQICHHQGTAVSLLTVQSLLKMEQLLRLCSEHNYYFCATPTCEVIYYSPTVDEYFSKNNVIVPVGIKEHTTPRLACYCFKFTMEAILDEIASIGSTTIPAQIKSAIKANTCDCERKNPSGGCCLGEIAQIIWQAQSGLPANGVNKLLPQLNCCKSRS